MSHPTGNVLRRFMSQVSELTKHRILQAKDLFSLYRVIVDGCRFDLKPPDNYTIPDQLNDVATGLGSEAGEVIGEIKRVTMFGEDLDVEATVKELGDVMYSVVALLNILDVSMMEVIALNIDKIEAKREMLNNKKPKITDFKKSYRFPLTTSEDMANFPSRESGNKLYPSYVNGSGFIQIKLSEIEDPLQLEIIVKLSLGERLGVPWTEVPDHLVNRLIDMSQLYINKVNEER